MNSLTPLALDAPQTAANDPRLGHWLAESTLGADTRVALLGFPSDEGVRRNGGRPGAAEGPRALREALYRMTPDAQHPEAYVWLLNRTVDLGDCTVTGDLEADQERLGETVRELLERSVIPVILGGGHETAFGHFLGYVGLGQPVSILNWDAHTDVRPLRDGRAHSGSPFRQALEHASGCCRRYAVAGAHPWRVADAHRTLIEEHGGGVRWLGDLDGARVRLAATETGAPAMASFDLDALDDNPGVSAPGVGGMPPRLWLHAAEVCGRHRAFSSFDVVELNPAHDAGGRSATLAALTVWHILRGIAAREG